MRRYIRNLSIRHKLNLIVMLTTTVALFTAFAAFILYDAVSARQEMSLNLSIMANIVAANSTAALSFKDPKTAREALAIFKANPHVLKARIYDKSGTVFAQDENPEGGKQTPASTPLPGTIPVGAHFEEYRLIVLQKIVLDNEELGAVYVESNLDELSQRGRTRLQTAAIVIFGALLTAFVISS